MANEPSKAEQEYQSGSQQSQSYYDICLCGQLWYKLNKGVKKIADRELECMRCAHKFFVTPAFIELMDEDKRTRERQAREAAEKKRIEAQRQSVVKVLARTVEQIQGEQNAIPTV